MADEKQTSNELEKKIEEATTTPLIESAKNAAERLEKANKELKDLLDRQEKIQQRQILGGKSEVFQTQEEKPEIAEKRKINELFAGTGIKIKI